MRTLRRCVPAAACATVLLLASGAMAACPPGARFAGNITSPRGEGVTLTRGGVPVIAYGGIDAVCTDDVILAKTSDVTLDLKVAPNHPFTVKRGFSYQVPTSWAYLLQMLTNPSGIQPQESELKYSATLGPNDPPTFGVAGLETSLAHIALSDRPLRLPVQNAQGAKVRLIDPTGRSTPYVAMPLASTIITLPAPRIPGMWRVEVAGIGNPLTGQFTVDRAPAQPPPELAALSGADLTTAMACIDVRRNGLQSLQQAQDEAGVQRTAAILWRWSDPEALDFCSGTAIPRPLPAQPQVAKRP